MNKKYLALIGVAALGLVYLLVRSIAEIWDICDFEVFWVTAERVLAGRLDFYEVTSPVKERYFVYPPSAAVLLAPLGYLSQEAAGVLWSIFKTIALGGLLWASVSVGSTRDAARGSTSVRVGLAVITALVVLQPITSDFGNGQINTMVAALGVIGAMGLMSPRQHRVVLGAVALACAVALKATPALLLLLPLWQKRWRSLGLAGTTSLGLVVLLPVLYFGPGNSIELFGGFSRASASLVAEIGTHDRQVSLNEVILFTMAQASEERDLDYDSRKRRLYRGTESGRVLAEIPLPLSTDEWRLLWLGQVVVILLLFTLLRRLAHRGMSSWQGDLALLCLLMLLLSPMIRRAHLVLLIAPVGWLVSRFHLHFQTRSPNGKTYLREAVGGGTLLLLWASHHVPIYFPASFPMPYRPALFLAVLGLIALVFLLEDSSDTDAASQPAGLT